MFNTESKNNISTQFILPMLKFSKKCLLEFKPNGFINTYVNTNVLDNFPMISILFKNELSKSNIDFFKRLSTSEYFISILEIINNQTLISFKIPKKFINDFYLIIEGRYSETSHLYKNLFSLSTISQTSTTTVTQIPTMFYHIFFKTDYLKHKIAKALNIETTNLDGQELWEKLNTTKETFMIDEEPII